MKTKHKLTLIFTRDALNRLSLGQDVEFDDADLSIICRIEGICGNDAISLADLHTMEEMGDSSRLQKRRELKNE